MSITTIRVTGTFTEGEVPPSGSVQFRLTAPVKNSEDRVLIPAFVRTAHLDAHGHFEIRLPASDDPMAAPGPVGYLVTWRLQNAETTQYGPVVVPYDSPGGVVDLFDLTPVTDPPPVSSTTVATVADVNAERAAREEGDDAAMAYIDAHTIQVTTNPDDGSIVLVTA